MWRVGALGVLSCLVVPVCLPRNEKLMGAVWEWWYEYVGAWLRRLFHRPPTVQDCIRAALRAPCEPTKAPERCCEPSPAWPSWRAVVHTEEAPGWGMYLEGCHRSDCDLQIVRPGKDQCRGDDDGIGCWWTRADQTQANRAAHEARYRDDTGWVVEWGEFTPEDV